MPGFLDSGSSGYLDPGPSGFLHPGSFYFFGPGSSGLLDSGPPTLPVLLLEAGTIPEVFPKGIINEFFQKFDHCVKCHQVS
jgi:hypothetical protein